MDYQDQYQEEGDNVDSPTTNRNLMSAKQERKKVEDNVKLLQNRIALLEAEEQKANKKIEETKKKAQEILGLKNRNREAQATKELNRQKQEQEIERRTEQNKQVKEQHKFNAENNKASLVQKIKSDVDMMKKIKDETKKTAKLIDEEDKLKNTQIVQSTKNREKELELKKQKLLEEKMQQARLEYESKIQEEQRIRAEKEALIQELEKREIELIQRLENTQNQQKQAFEDLELVLKDEHPNLMNNTNNSFNNTQKKSPYKPNSGSGSKVY